MNKNKKVKKMKEVEIEDEKSKEEIIETSTEEKINQLESEVLELKDKLLRKAAEFENFKKRTENDQMNLLTYAAESFIQKLLPVVDDFERSLQHIEDAQDIDAIKQGIKLIYDKLMKVFQEQGVKKIDSVGKHFDVDYHEALMQRADDSVEPHTVLDEIAKGYTYNDKVIRHTKVIVSEEKSSTEEETENVE
ncbi:MAG: nucleotide exchange factor GrpE [Ignavibacteria bacterium]|nr:nucleotide exchange factor GrpE [Ignavibacteria bacterium]